MHPLVETQHRFLALRVLFATFSVAAIGVMLWVVVNRIAYPYELDWIEGGMLHTVHRLVLGQPIYVRPTLDFIPLCYPPLYFMCARALVPVFGESFLALRMVSLGATFICFGLVALNTWLHTRSRFWAFCAAGLFAGCYGLGANWFDLGRVDMLFLAALLGGITVLEFMPGARGQMLAAVLVFLAFLTKQSALMAAIPLMAWTVLCGRGRTRWLFPVLLLSLIGGSWVWLHFRSGGWFTFYIHDIPRSYEIWWRMLILFWRTDIAVPSPALLFGMVFILYVTLRQESLARTLWVAAVLASVLSISCASRMHWGGAMNVVLPAYTLGSIFLARTAWMLEQPGALPHGLFRSRVFRILTLGLVVLQIYRMGYDPRQKIATERELTAADEFVDRLGAADGELWIPTHGWIAARVGSRWTAHHMAIMDVMRGADPRAAERLWREIEAGIRTQQWSMIITDDDYYEEVLDPGYEAQGPVFEGDYELYPKNTPIRPSTIYLPRQTER